MKREQVHKKKSELSPPEGAVVEAGQSFDSATKTVDDSAHRAANDAATDQMPDDLARVQDILFGNATRQLDDKLNALDIGFKRAVEQLQEQFNASVVALREEARLAVSAQEQELADNRAEILSRIDKTAAELTKKHLQSEKKAAATLLDIRNVSERRIQEVRQSQAILREGKVDRVELAVLLQQLADELNSNKNSTDLDTKDRSS